MFSSGKLRSKSLIRLSKRSVCIVNQLMIELAGLGPDSAFQMAGFEAYVDEAKQSRADYNARLMNVMRLYGIETEAEIMSCCINNLHEKLWNERHDASNIITLFRKKLVDEFLARFEADHRLRAGHHCRLQKASAWYWASYVDPDCEKFTVIRQKDVVTIRFLSFPWVVSKYLAEIYSTNREHKNLPERNIYMSIWDGLVHTMQSKKR